MLSRSRLTAILQIGLLVCGSATAATFTSIGENVREPSLSFILDQTYGEGAYERISDDNDRAWGPGQILSLTVIALHSSASQRLGLCAICDGSDDAFFGPSVSGFGVLPVDAANVLVASVDAFRWLDAASGAPMVGRVHSDPFLNPGGTDQMVSFAVVGRPGVYAIAFEDWLSDYSERSSDRDFNDFVVEVRFETESSLAAVPEPTSIVLFGTALLALVMPRRHLVLLARR